MKGQAAAEAGDATLDYCPVCDAWRVLVAVPQGNCVHWSCRLCGWEDWMCACNNPPTPGEVVTVGALSEDPARNPG